jgi:alpha-tubulin suppressor-like RCC1 family protein
MATNWSSLAAHRWDSCATRTDGTLWCWGSNGSSTNFGTAANLTVPNQVGTSASWAAVAVGSFHNCAIATNDLLWCWGDNTSGEVGDGTVIARSSPVRVVD